MVLVVLVGRRRQVARMARWARRSGIIVGGWSCRGGVGDGGIGRIGWVVVGTEDVEVRCRVFDRLPDESAMLKRGVRGAVEDRGNGLSIYLCVFYVQLDFLSGMGYWQR